MSADAAQETNREYDFIIVGSGAGGGPLAARLARAKLRVLLIEAGSDHSKDPATAGAHEVSLVPGLHAVSSEHPDLSWRFFVKHYTSKRPPFGEDPKWYPNPEIQQQLDDHKAHPEREGIFYPRSAGLGGCTIHNAMITIAGPDSDWDDLADHLQDPTWCSQQMRGYFRKLERNQYITRPDTIPQSSFRRAWHNVRWLLDLPIEFPSIGFSLRAPDYAAGGHGFRGWLRTSLTDFRLGLGDWQLIRMLVRAVKQSKRQGLNSAWMLVLAAWKGRIQQTLDPNHARTLREHPEGVVMVPLAVCGGNNACNSATPDVRRGRRSSPRELLREVVAECPEYLEIRTDCFVTRVLFEAPKGKGKGKDDRPRAVGVEYRRGKKLYRAHPVPGTGSSEKEAVFVGKTGEVILCGGSFNTPQLLMLSGIGDAEHLEAVAGGKDSTELTITGRDAKPLPGVGRIDLPGVGRNLQDRYEVTVVSEMKKPFELLDGATFRLPVGDPPKPDKPLDKWRKDGLGLYTSNGAVLGIFKRSRPDLAKPDLFIFGVPLPFEGYKVGYSNVGNIHNRFTWAILKGHTQNHDGTVRLRTLDPLDTPEINFHYFNEVTYEKNGTTKDDPDLLALLDGVKFIRGITDHNFFLGGWKEYSPGKEAVNKNDDVQIKDWIRRVAWGHHATGTCRMGADGDALAVLDSQFRVRKATGLRVVDASIFPKIPGYFIVTNIYMASEKAADVILQDHQAGAQERARLALKKAAPSTYPVRLREEEEKAVANRREIAGVKDGDKIGLAISGGGIRSATFNLGILQSMARGRTLRLVDFLSTVSGGGYIGSFLGRMFDHFREAPLAPSEGASAPDLVENELSDSQSRSILWLRKYANYIAPSGPGDERMDAATFLRNIISVHFVVGLLIFTVFGLADFVRYRFLDPAGSVLGLLTFTRSDLPLGHLIATALGPFFSPWFTLCEILILILVLPRMIGYWVVSQEKVGRYNPPGLALMLVLSGGLFYLGVAHGIAFESLALGASLLGSLVSAELVWRLSREREEALGTGGGDAERLRARALFTADLGVGLSLAGLALVAAIIDTIAHGLQQVVAGNHTYTAAFASFGAALAVLAPVARAAANFLEPRSEKGPPSTVARLARTLILDFGLTCVLLLVPLVFYAFSAHAAYQGGSAIFAGMAATVAALLLSWILTSEKAVAFANRSSLAETYAARLARTFLGASNPKRFQPEGGNVTEVIAGDDVDSITDYRPQMTGGPIHLINMTVNQTVDFSSQRGNRDRKGDNLAVSSIGISVGADYHALWGTPADEFQPEEIGAGYGKSAIPVGIPPTGAHPLLDEALHPARRLEVLSLRQWIAISGAAIDPGRGRETNLGRSLLFGLANLRTGYWWNSGIGDAARDGFPNLTRLSKLLYLLPRLFLTQYLVVAEWISRFPGPWEQFWYLSDGGFFEGLGAYELVRRRVPRIIVCDSLEDDEYKFEDWAQFIRLVNEDFGASVEEVKELVPLNLPTEVLKCVGTEKELKAADGGVGVSQKHAALFWVKYPDGSKSILLYVKSSVTGDESGDILSYRADHGEFPHESTVDQFFNEPQWESYRRLGEHIGGFLFEDLQWFKNIPL